ncbi:hypothetical protein, partial [Crocosphaera watsonii]|uniref:hypothetical protein n=1 Tax=Crocosphaera watsonii TaxID=263511 RepID=UPI00195523B2
QVTKYKDLPFKNPFYNYNLLFTSCVVSISLILLFYLSSAEVFSLKDEVAITHQNDCVFILIGEGKSKNTPYLGR